MHCIVVIFLDEHFDLTKATLETISCACVLTNDESVPHKCNQGIVFTSGTHASITIAFNYTTIQVCFQHF